MSVLLALGTLYLAVVDATRVLDILKYYADPSLGSKEATYLRNEAVTSIVRTLDSFLITSILLIFVRDLRAFHRRHRSNRLIGSCASLPSRAQPEPVKRERGEARHPGAGNRILRCCSKRTIRSASRSFYLSVGILLVSGGFYLTAPRNASEPQISEDTGKDRRDEP
jgi:hypothetical protein